MSLVRNVMNPELFHLRLTDSAEDALNGLLAFGITGAPVLDEGGRPMGMVSLRELAQRRAGQKVSEIMASPALTIGQAAPASEGARILAESGHHRMVVVDEEGRAVGNVSALDLLRAQLGLKATHPPAFPHFDPATGLTWSDPAPLETSAIEDAPDGPGIFALLWEDASGRRHVVWAETARNVYSRLADLVSTPQTDRPLLASWLARGGLRFRAARVDDPAKAREALHRLHGHG
jgi:hypothetical protein